MNLKTCEDSIHTKFLTKSMVNFLCLLTRKVPHTSVYKENGNHRLFWLNKSNAHCQELQKKQCSSYISLGDMIFFYLSSHHNFAF